MDKRSNIEVIIDGKQYEMMGYEGEEYLHKLAAYINAKLTDLKAQKSYPKLDSGVKNVLLQINIADDFFKMKKAYEEELEESERKTKEIADLKREKVALQTKLEAQEQTNQTLREENLELQKKVVRLETELEERKKRGVK